MASIHPGGKRTQFRYTDALEVKPRFIAGEPLEDLAAELAEKRQTDVNQALQYLQRVRGRERWIEERQFHLEAVADLAATKMAQNRAAALAKSQGSMADRLIQKGLNELNDSKAKTRMDVLQTLESGYRFAYRAAGLPDKVVDPNLLPRQEDATDAARRQSELQKMNGNQLLTLAQRLIEESQKYNQPSEPEPAPPEE